VKRAKEGIERNYGTGGKQLTSGNKYMFINNYRHTWEILLVQITKIKQCI